MLTLTAIAVALVDRLQLRPANEALATQNAKLQREAKNKTDALTQFQADIDGVSDNRQTLIPAFGGDKDTFFAAFDTVIRQRTHNAGIHINQFYFSGNAIEGTSRTPGLLPMPKDIAIEYAFVLNGNGRFDQWINFAQSLNDLPAAISKIEMTTDAWEMEIVAWHLQP